MFLYWILAPILLAGSPAWAREPPDCRGIAGKQVAWIVGTIVSLDKRTTRCTISAPVKGTDPRACIHADATQCSWPFELRIDDVAVGGGGTSCFKPGVYTAELCGTRCDKTTFLPGTLVDLYVEDILPRLKVRVDTVWRGGARLQGTMMEGAVFAVELDSLSVGVSMEFFVSETGQFTAVEQHCGYEAMQSYETPGYGEAPGNVDDQGVDAGALSRNQAPRPGCTRCDSSSETGVAHPFAGVFVLAFMLRRRRTSEYVDIAKF